MDSISKNYSVFFSSLLKEVISNIASEFPKKELTYETMWIFFYNGSETTTKTCKDIEEFYIENDKENCSSKLDVKVKDVEVRITIERFRGTQVGKYYGGAFCKIYVAGSDEAIVRRIIDILDKKCPEYNETKLKPISGDIFVSKIRIEDLRKINNHNLDVSRLIELCEELNSNWNNGNLISSALLIIPF